MQDDAENADSNVDQLSREQLKIYARELSELYTKERVLRKELEDRNQLLAQRVKEIEALNELFQKHLKERYGVVESYLEVLLGLQGLAEDSQKLLRKALSQPLPDLSDLTVQRDTYQVPPSND